MTTLRLQILLSLTLFLMVGCRDQTPSRHGGGSQATATDFAARLEAAEAIQNLAEHDDALADLAKDAAKAGDGAITKSAIDGIRTSSLHDSAAADAAVLLAKGGKSADALVIAKSIRQSSLRDQTLSAIAKGD
jgi:hypothetical protein